MISQGDDGERRPPRSRLARLAALYRDTALIAFAMFVILTGFELAAYCALALLERRPHHAEQLGYYADQDWSPAYWREHQRLDTDGWRRYEPFVVWRIRPVSGDTINVDAKGIRRTPGARCGPDSYTLFALGGSTMWGIASPDWLTIPAQLQEVLGERLGRPVCVVNLAQGGYVSSQEFIELARRLQAGERPEAVIFYDGINDVVAAAESGRAAVHQGLAQIAERFDHRRPLPIRVFAESNLGHLLERLQYRILGLPPYPEIADPRALAQEIVDLYVANHAMVAALGRSYGFRSYSFWQPVLCVGEKRLSPRERLNLEAMDPRLKDLFELTYRLMRETAPRHEDLFDLADILDAFPDEAYTDLFHVVPAANRRIAERMVELAWGGPTQPLATRNGAATRTAATAPPAPGRFDTKLAAPLD